MPENTQNTETSKVQSRDLLAFIEEFLLPVIAYTADKRAYISNCERAHYTGQDTDDYDSWAKSRAMMAVKKWDEIKG